MGASLMMEKIEYARPPTPQRFFREREREREREGENNLERERE